MTPTSRPTDVRPGGVISRGSLRRGAERREAERRYEEAVGQAYGEQQDVQELKPDGTNFPITSTLGEEGMAPKEEEPPTGASMDAAQS